MNNHTLRLLTEAIAPGALGRLLRPSTPKKCSRCQGEFHHRGAYCAACHVSRKAEGKVK
jgi:ribosomal protein L37E